MSIPLIVLEKLSMITSEVEARGGKVVVLNDVVLPLYGLVKTIDEIRILVYHEDIGEAVYHVLNILGLTPYINDVVKSIKYLGIAVINPVVIPMTIIETPRKEIDKAIMLDNEVVELDNYRIRIPRIEDFIVKMLTIGKYPYTLYAYTLLASWINEIDLGKVEEKASKNSIDVSKIINTIKDIVEVAKIFPETGL